MITYSLVFLVSPFRAPKQAGQSVNPNPVGASYGHHEQPQDFAQFVSTAGWAVGGAQGARDLQKRKAGATQQGWLTGEGEDG